MVVEVAGLSSIVDCTSALSFWGLKNNEGARESLQTDESVGAQTDVAPMLYHHTVHTGGRGRGVTPS